MSKRTAVSTKLKVVRGATKRTGDLDRFEALFEQAIDAILVVELDTGRIVSVNQAALEMTGYLRQDIEDREVEMLFPKGTAVPFGGKRFSREFVSNSGLFEDVVLFRRDGYPRFVSMSVKATELDGRRVSLCILRDVTEKKNMERDVITKHNELRNAYVELEKAHSDLKTMQDQLVQAGKLAALGELSAGIAHELKNPLQAVKGYAQMGLRLGDGADPSKIAEYFREIEAASVRMDRIISHLRDFTRKSTEDFEMIDISASIDESLKMLEMQFRSRGIEVEKIVDRDVPKIYANPFQLEQVFINLATNARDAIEQKKEPSGRIKVRVRRADDDRIEVIWSDNGCGIPEHVKSKIFNPFFTTKEVGKGMGLGLSITYGILEKINATILVESSPGKGSMFTIRIPVDYRHH